MLLNRPPQFLCSAYLLRSRRKCYSPRCRVSRVRDKWDAVENEIAVFPQPATEMGEDGSTTNGRGRMKWNRLMPLSHGNRNLPGFRRAVAVLPSHAYGYA